MKILVAVKRVVDFNVKIRIKADGSGVDTEQVKMSMNPFDEIAIEEAVRLKEQGIANEICVVTVGSAPCQETLRSALALGADRGILVSTEPNLEPLLIARILEQIAKQEQPRLIILGKQAIDDDCNQTGQMLAALLNWPQGTFASQLKIIGSQAEVTREVDQGMETINLTLPAVITTDLRLNQPRYATLPNIMRAKQKPIKTLSLSELGIQLESHLEILDISSPVQKKSGVKVNSFKELIEKLQEQVENT